MPEQPILCVSDKDFDLLDLVRSFPSLLSYKKHVIKSASAPFATSKITNKVYFGISDTFEIPDADHTGIV